jgi:single-stranded-DNA-specific exonuclease
VTFRWIVPKPAAGGLPRLHDDQLIHDLLANHGIVDPADAAAFLDRRPGPAPNPAGLPNLASAVARIGAALDAGEQIGIFGDYDADGITATAVLTLALRAAAIDPAQILPRLPTREQGYGLNGEVIQAFAEDGITLLIAVDCASSDHEGVAAVRELGIDLIAVDHHQIAGSPPAGAIVVSPQLPGGQRFADLCAAGVAYMVVTALAREGYRVGGSDGAPETALLDLVALGTIGDMVPVSGINRAIVRDGIALLQRGGRPGLASLCRRAGIEPAYLSSEQIVFKLGPRLNAAGRIGDPRLALDLLLARDLALAAPMVDELEALNEERRAQSARVLREAEVLLSAEPQRLERRVLVVAGDGWPVGMLGPVASQLVDRFSRPVVVLTTKGTSSHGSARSVPGLDMFALLRSCEELLIRFGGHDGAAGLTLETATLPAFEERIDAAAMATGIDLPFKPTIQFAAETSADRLNLATAELLQQLEPFGKGNEQPVLLIPNVSVRQYDVVGADRRHLRMQLDGPGGSVKAIGFGLAERSKTLMTHRRIDLAAVLKVDRWNGQRRLDVEVRDFRPSGSEG